MTKYFAFGAVFGLILSRVGASSYDAIVGMFEASDLHLMGVMGVAAVCAGTILRVTRNGPWHDRLAISGKPFKPGMAAGAVVFGAGWGLSGACPGTSLAQLGEGQLMALFTIAGLFLGSGLHRAFGAKVERLFRATDS